MKWRIKFRPSDEVSWVSVQFCWSHTSSPVTLTCWELVPSAKLSLWTLWHGHSCGTICTLACFGIVSLVRTATLLVPRALGQRRTTVTGAQLHTQLLAFVQLFCKLYHCHGQDRDRMRHFLLGFVHICLGWVRPTYGHPCLPQPSAGTTLTHGQILSWGAESMWNTRACSSLQSTAEDTHTAYPSSRLSPDLGSRPNMCQVLTPSRCHKSASAPLRIAHGLCRCSCKEKHVAGMQKGQYAKLPKPSTWNPLPLSRVQTLQGPRFL